MVFHDCVSQALLDSDLSDLYEFRVASPARELTILRGDGSFRGRTEL